jgi:hypothetical protein
MEPMCIIYPIFLLVGAAAWRLDLMIIDCRP